MNTATQVRAAMSSNTHVNRAVDGIPHTEHSGWFEFQDGSRLVWSQGVWIAC